MKYKSEQLELSIVLPCLNEAETIGICLKKAAKFLQENKINGELVVGDNDSSDGSQEIALSFGARVVDVSFVVTGPLWTEPYALQGENTSLWVMRIIVMIFQTSCHLSKNSGTDTIS